MRDYSAINRAKLVDEPIVEMLLTKKYKNSELTIMKSDIKTDYEGADIICISNGTKRFINVKRNSSKHFNSPNFSISIDKNKLNTFKNTQFAFIDESANSIYMVDGVKLLSYILEHSEKISTLKYNENKAWAIIPKNDIALMTSDNDHIIKYNKNIARLLEIGRDESQFVDLF